MSLYNYPKQRLSYTEKTKNKDQWGKMIIDHLVNYTDNYESGNYSSLEYQRMLSNYKLYNNEIEQTDFQRECNPLGINVGQLNDEIQPYNKTYNKINVLLGENLKRPLNFKVVLSGTEGTSRARRAKTELLRKYVTNQLQQEIEKYKGLYEASHPLQDKSEKGQQQYQQQEQQEIDTILSPDQVEKYMKSEWQDEKAIMSSKILKYLIKEQDIKDKKNDTYKHALISGKEAAWVGIIGGKPVVDIVNPLGLSFHKSPEVKYIQDGLYASYTTQMDIGQIMDKYGDDLSDTDIQYLEDKFTGVEGVRADVVGKEMNYNHDQNLERKFFGKDSNSSIEEGSFGKYYYSDITVYHVEWKSQKKIGFLTYMSNETGEQEMQIVDEEFVLDRNLGHISIEWDWIPEVWEGTRIGNNIYANIGPKMVQFRSNTDPYKCKLGYHGLVYNNMNAQSVSMMDRMKPYQYLYFFAMHKMKKLVARDRGQLLALDSSMIDPEIGMEKTLYYIDEMDLQVYNPYANQDNPAARQVQRPAMQGTQNRSNMQHILNYVGILNYLDNQIGEVAGVNRNREGQTSPNEAVTNVQSNITQTSHITEIYFAAHNNNWKHILTSLLQTAQVAYKQNPLITSYLLSDSEMSVLDTEEFDIADSDFDIFLSDSAKEDKVFEELRALAQPLLQNDKARYSDIVKLLTADSTTELKKDIEQVEDNRDKQQQQAVQSQQEHEAKLEQMTKDTQEKEQQNKLDAIRVKGDIDIQIAEIKAAQSVEGLSTDSPTQDINDNHIPDAIELVNDSTKKEIANNKIALDRDKMKQDKEKATKELSFKDKQLKSKEMLEKLKIAQAAKKPRST